MRVNLLSRRQGLHMDSCCKQMESEKCQSLSRNELRFAHFTFNEISFDEMLVFCWH